MPTLKSLTQVRNIKMFSVSSFFCGAECGFSKTFEIAAVDILYSILHTKIHIDYTMNRTVCQGLKPRFDLYLQNIGG